MTGGRRKGRRGQLRQDKALLEALSQVLSEQEMQRVLGGALLEMDQAGRRRLIKRLGKDTGAALQQVLEPEPGHKQQRPGKDKIRQGWKRLWGEWNDCVFESSSEDGRYVIQDEHWEPPYFDSMSLAADLEPIAARMRELIPRVVDEELDPEFSFSGAIEEADAEIGSGLSEWIDDPEGCGFGQQVTTCLLEWEWRVGQRAGRDPFEIVDSICNLDSSLRRAGLDGEAIARFVRALGEPEQQVILKGIAEHQHTDPWATVLREPRSGWFALHQELARRLDTDQFLASCRANITQDWELALPPVKDLLGRKAFDEAQSLVEEAVTALLQLSPGETWDPRQGLLIQHWSQQHWMESKTTRVQLLKAWRRVAAGLGQEDLACALELQAELVTKWEDWDAALKAFRKAEGSACAAVCSRLFSDWCERVSVATVGRVDGWVLGLADAAHRGDTALFHEAVRGWLGQVESTPDDLKRSRRSLETLTMMVGGSRLKQAAPALWRLISDRPEKKGKLAESLRQWIKRLRGHDLFPEVLGLWKRNAASLVPDPAQTRGSHYGDCADWLAVVHDLDRQAYTLILRDWSERHRRRRNLWEAIKQRRLPVEVTP